MNKKYELLQWYPGLPEEWEEGDIIELQRRPSLYENTRNGVSALAHEDFNNYPRFWKKVHEYTYKIEKLRLPNNPPYKITQLSQSASRNRVKNGHQIHAVRRLSDDEIFEVDDPVESSKGTYGRIESFSISGKTIVVSLKNRPGSPVYLSTLRPSKPVFTTHDGIKTYVGDFHFVPQLDSQGKYYTGLVAKHITTSNPTKYTEIKGVYRFSSMHKAKRWASKRILRYSQYDIEKAFENFKRDMSVDDFFANLKEHGRY